MGMSLTVLCGLLFLVWADSLAIADDFFDKLQQRSRQRYEKAAKTAEQRYGEAERTALRLYGEIVRSSEKRWVQLENGGRSRLTVDFEQGEVIIETVETGEKPSIEAAELAIETVGTKLLSEKPEFKYPPILDQLADADGKPLTPVSKKRYFTTIVKPNVSKTLASEGKTRFTVKLKLLPNHLEVRARRYLGYIESVARKYGLDRALVLAVIHTESYFNPRAISPVGAIGLMQIMPQYAGQEVLGHLGKTKTSPTLEEWYDPEFNVFVGSTYLHLLMSKADYFGTVTDPLKRQYLTICGYNWGPHNVKRKVVEINPITLMTPTDLFALLRRSTPNETSAYLLNVTERIGLYKDVGWLK